jgi:hypothetical protein
MGHLAFLSEFLAVHNYHNRKFLKNYVCRFWIIGGLGAMTVIGYQSIRQDNAITGGINRLV